MKKLYLVILIFFSFHLLSAQPCSAITSTGTQSNVSCNGGVNGTASVIPTNGTGPYTYSWAPSGGTAATASGLSAGSYTVTIIDANGCTGTRTFTITQPATLSATGGFQTNVNCNGGSNGSATVFASGGTAPYTYSWSVGGTTQTRSGLSAGTYTVTVTDSKGCTATRNFTITQPPALTTSGSQTNVSCNGGTNGSATVTVSGGTAPYTYSWAPAGGTGATASGLAAGTYTVIVTDSKSCTTSRNFIISEPVAPVSGSTVVTNASCGSDGTIDLTPSGGTPPYTFDWGAGITTEDRAALSAGTYSVTITDSNGCTGSVNATVGTSGSVTGTTVVTNVACNGDNNGAINLTPTGGTGPYTYSWNDGPTTQDRAGLTAGTYTVVITDANGCQATIASTVNQPLTAITGSTVITNVACNGGTTGAINLTPTGGTGPYTFNWGGGITTEDRTGLAAGNYSVVITDANGCTGTVNATVTQPASAISGSTVVTNVACNGGTTGAINLTPTGGTGPYTFNWGGGITTEDRTGLAAGNYSVVITDANGCTGTVNATVNQPSSALSGTTVVTHVACNGGSTGAINLTPTGGTGPYTFNWGGGITTEDRTGLTAGNYTVTITDANGCTGTVSVTVMQPSVPISGTIGIFNVSCFGGSNGLINLTPSGGIAPYTFNWDGGITTEDRTSLAAGTYTVVITDANGCTGTVTATITQPAPVSGTTVVTNIACNGGFNGTINLTPTGGTPPYTYNWGGGITTEDRAGLPAGNYTVTITDNVGCTGTVNVTITQPAAPVSGTTVVTNVACNGGTTGAINLTPTGGTAPYTFNWGGGITTEDRTGLAAGTYTAIITDANGCTGTVSATITEPAALDATAIAQTNVSCSGGSNGSATVGVTGGTGAYTYSWAPSGGTGATATGLAAGTYTVTVTDANGCTDTESFIITQPSALVASASAQANVSCNGGSNGSVTVAVTGGTGAYTYSWAPSGGTGATATGLAAGTYTVTVTDANGCTATQSFTITQPSALVASASAQTNVSCNGGSNGSATVAVTGGTGAYTYSWAPSGGTAATATGLSAGTYTVTVTDANGCTATQSFTITQPSALVASASAQANVSCNGGSNGSATVAVTGGTGAYTYSWAPSGGTAATATGLAAGTYTVTVTDANGCTTTQSFTITQPSALVASASVQTNVSCNGGSNGSATVAVTGGTGAYTYSWAPSGGTGATATGLSAGTYTVTVTDANGCTTTQSFTITQPSALVASASAQTNVSCNGGSNGSATVAVTGGTGAYTYLWAPSGGTGATATGLSAGTYTLTVTDANGCTATQSFTITQPSALVASASAQANVSCNGGSNGSATVAVTGGTGAYTYSWAPSGGTAATATGLAAGTYTVTVTDANGCTTTQSFTITQPSALVASASAQANVSCNGGSNGSATVAVTGGTGAYTYLWAPSGGIAATATGLSAGTYTVTVTDANGCTATQSFTITEPASAISGSTVVTNVACNGGTTGAINLTPTGGTGPYTFNWGGGITTEDRTGLSAGNYSVTITDANGCTTTQSFTITEPSALVASASAQANVSCNGGSNGSASVAVTGGTGAYTYSWAPSGGTGATATGLAAGTYTVTVTDANGCTTTQSFTLTQPSAFVASTSAQTNVSCNGGSNGSATVAATGGTGAYTYSWAPSGGTAATATGLTAGTYTVTVTDANGCTTTQSFTITQPAALVASASAQTNVSCNGGSNGSATVAVTGGTGAYTYSWAPSGGTGATATGLAAGTYTVTVTDANGCTTTQSFTITQPSALVASASAQTNVSCNGESNGSATVAVTGGTGAYTYSWAPSGGTGATATGLAAGTYTVTVTDDNGCTATESVEIITTPDITPPVADMINLPAITSYCAVLEGEINIPTATDNCAGTITATTSSQLNYTIEGTYVITWSYDDGNGNIISQDQTINVLPSPLGQVTFDDAGFIYNGNVQTIQVENLPAGATVEYSTTPATGTDNGAVNAGVYTVTATVTPPAEASNCESVILTATLTIQSSSAAASAIIVAGHTYENPAGEVYHLIDCSDNADFVEVTVIADGNVVVSPANTFTIQTPQPGIYTQQVTVTSQDGASTSTYTIIVERRFNFFDIVEQKFDNLLLVNNNPTTNGGYEFVSFEWYKNDELIGEGQYYSAGDQISDILDASAEYRVVMTTSGGEILQTCIGHIELEHNYMSRLYPNPARAGKLITVETDFPEQELEQMEISVYSLTGSLITKVKSSGRMTQVQLPATIEEATYVVLLESPNVKKALKVIVKK